MICPYCGEAVKEEAIVCRSCHKDLTLYKPVMQQVEQLEASIDKLKSDLEALRAKGASTSNFLPHSNLLPITVSLLLSVGLSFVFYWISWQQILLQLHMTGKLFEFIFLFLSAAAPFIAALFLGLCTTHLGPMMRALLGLLAGVLGYTQMYFVYHSSAFMFHMVYFLYDRSNTPYPAYEPIQHLPTIFTAYAVAGICLYIAGYAAGERFRNRNDPNPPRVDDSGYKITRLLPALNPYIPIVVALIGLLSSCVAAKR